MQSHVLAFVFLISTAGLVYELIAGTVASYLLGDSIAQFSTVIGVYLFAMGVGSYITRFVHKNLPAVFVQTQILTGLFGGSGAAVLFLGFELVQSFQLLLYGVVATTGILVGFEIPLLMRLLRGSLNFRELVSRVFALDYVGALFAAFFFPLFLVPHVGLIRSGFVFGALNTGVAVGATFLFAKVNRMRLLRVQAFLVLALQLILIWNADRILKYTESMTYPDPVIFASSTPYQRIAITSRAGDLRLFLNGNLQFSSRDEYRYHEALVHPLLASLRSRKHVLVLGGGDGLAVREILRYPDVLDVTLVDLDPAMTRIFSTHPTLIGLNANALNSPRVHVVNADALLWLRENRQHFDAAIVDFPDPSTFSTGKLYTVSMYRLLLHALTPQGGAVIQATSPYFAPRSFWTVNATLQEAGLWTHPYHVYVPSFGEWGFLLAAPMPLNPPADFSNAKFINPAFYAQMNYFPDDMTVRAQLEPNRLNNQVLVRLFEQEWNRYGRQ